MKVSEGMIRVLVRATEAFVDREEDTLPSAEASGVPERLRRMLAQLPRDQVLLLRIGTLVLDGLSVARFGRGFRRLDAWRARKLLRAIAGSPLGPLRRLHHVLKMMCQFAYFASEATWGITGYDGPWLGRIEVAAGPPPAVGVEERS